MSFTTNDGGRVRSLLPRLLLIACTVVLSACVGIGGLLDDEAAVDPTEPTATTTAPASATTEAPPDTTPEDDDGATAGDQQDTDDTDAPGVALGGYDREATIDDLIAQAGVTQPVAECIVDGMEEEIGPQRLGEVGDPTADEEQVIIEITTECLLGDIDG
ncbi:MAG: hypothetical protein AAF962_23620 [Actinomycetota bacterium]